MSLIYGWCYCGYLSMPELKLQQVRQASQFMRWRDDPTMIFDRVRWVFWLIFGTRWADCTLWMADRCWQAKFEQTREKKGQKRLHPTRGLARNIAPLKATQILGKTSTSPGPPPIERVSKIGRTLTWTKLMWPSYSRVFFSKLTLGGIVGSTGCYSEPTIYVTCNTWSAFWIRKSDMVTVIRWWRDIRGRRGLCAPPTNKLWTHLSWSFIHSKDRGLKIALLKDFRSGSCATVSYCTGGI